MTLRFLCHSSHSSTSWTATIVIYNGLFWHYLKLLAILEHILPNLRKHYRKVDWFELGYKLIITNSDFVKSTLLLEIQAPLTIEQANEFKFISPILKLFSPHDCHMNRHYRFIIDQRHFMPEVQ